MALRARVTFVRLAFGHALCKAFCLCTQCRAYPSSWGPKRLRTQQWVRNGTGLWPLERISPTDIRNLERLDRATLRTITGLPKHTKVSAHESAGGLLPLQDAIREAHTPHHMRMENTAQGPSEDVAPAAIQSILRRHEKADRLIEIIWTPGHTGVPGGNAADTPLLLLKVGRPIFLCPDPSG
ncbi:hypothetical protein HPB52_009989 [Rhipicephalus sanguineus]|uniref:Uncharacterized protein n=1 Tax=Rhipicephalus sanguineus TaxID=34632 RepID=A0A9D4SNE8_RHISA|nr:hypothetical protein HPB52_009989 [Rhipicephalus sanguineus]